MSDSRFNIHFLLISAPSDPVENLIISRMQTKDEMLTQPHNNTVVAKWNFPCRPNSKIIKFLIKFEEDFNKDEVLEYFIENQKNQDSFEFTVNDLVPDTNYIVKVLAISENDLEGKETFVRFAMEAGSKYL